MKKIIQGSLAVLMGLSVAIGVTACAEETPPPDEPNYEYSLSKTTLTLEVGDTEQLSVLVTPSKDITVEYTTSAEAIATVAEDGTVTAVAEGTATIYAAVDGKTLNCSVTVTDTEPAPPEYSYTLNKGKLALTEGETGTLLVIVEPEKDISVTFTSSDDEIATVDKDGKVTAVKAGVATISAQVDGKTLTCEVTVNPKPVVYTYELNKTELALDLGAAETLSVVTTPVPETAPVVTWESSNRAVATVENGRVTAVGVGTATVTATVAGEELTCSVTVSSAVTAGTVSVQDVENRNIFLDDCDGTLSTLYWEHYQNNPVTVDKKAGAESYVVSSDAYALANTFGDYKAGFTWVNGSVNPVTAVNKNGVHSVPNGTNPVSMTFNVNAGVKAIRIYTGAWRATNTVSLWMGDIRLAEAEAFSADDNSVAREVTFPVTVTKAAEVIVKITPSELGENGNASVVAVAVLGAEKTAYTPNAQVTMHQHVVQSDKNDPSEVYDLTEIGTVDWFYVNNDASERKNGGTAVKGGDIKIADSNGFTDYPAAFNWTDGTTNATSPTEGDNNNKGTNNGKCGSAISVGVDVAAGTSVVTLWVGGYQSTYHVMAYDGNGKVVLNDVKLADATNDTVACMLQFVVTAEAADSLTFFLYRESGVNCSLVAVAVGGYRYSISNESVELTVGDTRTIGVSSDPEKDLTVSYSTSDGTVATVDGNGLITAVGEGTATITATVDGETLTCAVTVHAEVINYEYTLNKTTLALGLGDSETLTVAVNPTPVETPVITWATLDETVATVENGTVKAVGAGTTTITATVGEEELTCAVTVTSKVTAGEVTVVDIAGQERNIDNSDDTLSTLYWEHYQSTPLVTDKMRNVESYITQSDVYGFTRSFGDYKARISWSNSANNTAWGRNTNGVHCNPNSTAPVCMTINVNANVKAIKLFTGAWRASNTVSLWLNGVCIAQAAAFSAGDDSVAREVTFPITVSEETTVEVRLTPSELGTDGNVMVVGVAILGTAETATTSVSLTKTEMTGYATNAVNLTEVGSKDWYYLNYDNVSDRKQGGSAIKPDSLKVESNGKFWDYKAAFSWTDGTTYPQSPVDNDNENHGTNNGMCGAYVNISVAVANGDKVTLWIGGWSSTYYVQVIDSKGNTIFREKMADGVNNVTHAYQVAFDVTAAAEDELTFIIYNAPGSGGNSSLAAVAVS